METRTLSLEEFCSKGEAGSRMKAGLELGCSEANIGKHILQIRAGTKRIEIGLSESGEVVRAEIIKPLRTIDRQ